jgi:3-oxoacyl-[acyl-carrier-protein] synthase III
MQGRDVFAFTQTVVPDFINSFLNDRGLSSLNIDLFLFHQANSFIIDRLRAKLGIPKQKMPDQVIRVYGNSSSGSVPMCIANMPPQQSRIKVMACGFGVGLSWGAALFELDKLDFCEIIDF